MAEPAGYVQPQAYDEAGQAIAPDAAPAAVAAGKAFFQQGARVYARNAQGDLVTVAPEHAAHPGYQILTPGELAQAHAQKQYGEGLGNVAKAGLAGAARGLTMGASDAVLTGIGGDDTRRALQGLREANPLTSTTSEVAGAVAPVLLSGGSAAPAEAAGLARAGNAARTAVRAAGALPRAVAAGGGLVERGFARGLTALGYEGKSLAGRVAAGALKVGAQGAAEGAVYGGAQAANDAVLNGDEITAEKIVAGMGHGALFGAAVGTGLGGAGQLVKGAAAKLIPKPEALEQLSREQAGRAAGFKASDYKSLVGRARGDAAEHRIAATLDDLRNYEIKSGELAGQRLLQPTDNAEQILERVRAAKNETAASLGGLKDEISESMTKAGYAPDTEALLRRIDDNVFKPASEGATPSIHRRIQMARRELSGLVPDELDHLGLVNSKYARDGMRDMTSIRSAYEGATPAEVREIALGQRAPMGSETGKPLTPVRVELYPDTPPVLNDGRHRMLAAKEAGADSILANVVSYDGEGNVIGEQLRSVSIEPKRLTFRDLDKMRQRIRETFQPPPVKGGGLPPPAPKNAAYLEGAERELAAFLKDEASTFLAKAGEDPNAYNELNRRYHSFRQLDDVGTKATAHNLGNRMISPSDHALGVAGFMGALATGNVGAVGAAGMGGAASIANKLLRERGNSLVADMARRAAEMDLNIDRVAQALAGKLETGKVATLAATLQGENLRQSYERTADRVRELATPQTAMAHLATVAPEVAAQYPLTGAAVSTKLLQIYEQLKAKLPKSHVDTGATLTPLAVRERITPLAMRSFLSSVRGATDPESVMRDLGHGIVDRTAIDMLKVTHPRTWQQLRGKVADYVGENQTEVPYKRRVMLSMVFDFAGDSSLEPARMAGLQQVAQSLSLQEQQQETKMATPKKTGERKSKLGDSLSLPAYSAFGGT